MSYSLGLPHTETMSCIINGSSIEKSALLDRHFSKVFGFYPVAVKKAGKAVITLNGENFKFHHIVRSYADF